MIKFRFKNERGGKRLLNPSVGHNQRPLDDQSRYFRTSAPNPGQGPAARQLDPCDLG